MKKTVLSLMLMTLSTSAMAMGMEPMEIHPDYEPVPVGIPDAFQAQLPQPDLSRLNDRQLLEAIYLEFYYNKNAMRAVEETNELMMGMEFDEGFDPNMEPDMGVEFDAPPPPEGLSKRTIR
jgi:hypothetical protein